MKKNSFTNQILALGIGCIFILSGCAAKEPVFVDTQVLSREILPQENEEAQSTPDKVGDVSGQETCMPVVVHICGAVMNPGVYELPAGSRIMDAVNMAGGLRQDADESYVNLAAIPADGEQIIIPTTQEAAEWKQTVKTSDTPLGKVNINTADKSLLCTLPGIGDTRAESIIAYRQKHGCFLSIEDIMQVSGIKESSFQKIKELIAVN